MKCRPVYTRFEPVSSVTIVTRLRTGQQEYLGFITDGNETQLRHCKDYLHGNKGGVVTLTIQFPTLRNTTERWSFISTTRPE